MRTDNDLDRAVRLWVAQGSDQLPEPALDAALDQIASTNQRHAGWRARRTNLMNGNALKLGFAAVAIIAVALLGMRFLPSMVGGPPDPTPTPTPVSLASGSFTADLGEVGRAFDIEATRTGDDVSGALEVSNPEGAYSVDLQCARATDDGLLVISGEVTESTNETLVEGAYLAIAFAPGTPVRTLLAWDVDASDPAPSPAESCPAFLESLLGDPAFVEGVDDHAVPIEGELELNP
jgi:hypothetical protein